MADIFGRHNSALEREGTRLVQQAKAAHQKKREHARKEIEAAIKDSPLHSLNSKRVSVIVPAFFEKRTRRPGKTTYVFNKETGSFEPKADNLEGIGPNRRTVYAGEQIRKSA